jgi:hypothetical protein
MQIVLDQSDVFGQSLKGKTEVQPEFEWIRGRNNDSSPVELRTNVVASLQGLRGVHLIASAIVAVLDLF